jgi:hypothetical protein
MATLLNSFQMIANASFGQRELVDEKVFGRKLGFIARLIGCRHRNIGRPFGEGKTAYRSCVSCGARKPFNTQTLETSRVFYCPPVIQP